MAIEWQVSVSSMAALLKGGIAAEKVLHAWTCGASRHKSRGTEAVGPGLHS